MGSTQIVELSHTTMSVFGKWKLVNSESFDDYMKAVGVGWALRKAGAMASSTTEITQEADGIRVNTQSTVKSSNFVFPDGKAVEYTTMDGRKTMTTVSIQGDKIVSEECWDGKKTTLTFSADANNMVITLEHGGVVCKRFHDKA